jgi:hypothetical protein
MSVFLIQHVFLNLKILSNQKKGGQERYQSILLDLVHNRRYFLSTLKGLIFCFKCKKLASAFSVKKFGVFFYVESGTKNSEAHLDIALLLLVGIGGVGYLGNCCAFVHMS